MAVEDMRVHGSLGARFWRVYADQWEGASVPL
ncbi:hypothetical protein GGD63_001092 [Bradyrhizobium sp. cir1]|nr:hypothetical protein [Bradyrhizobium sp. cir1]